MPRKQEIFYYYVTWQWLITQDQNDNNDRNNNNLNHLSPEQSDTIEVALRRKRSVPAVVLESGKRNVGIEPEFRSKSNKRITKINSSVLLKCIRRPELNY